MTTTIEKVKVTPKVGDILYSSWGYDQTNIDFYKVVKVSEFSVWIQELSKKIVEITGWAHERVVPTDSSTYETRNYETNEIETRTYAISRHKIQYPTWQTEKEYYVKLNSFSSASPWDGKPKDASHTH